MTSTTDTAVCGRLLIVGDSWSMGIAATPRTEGFAHLTGRLLGMSVEVDGLGATGYLNPGTTGEDRTYLARLNERAGDGDVGLVVVQGGINDRHAQPEPLRQAARLVIARARELYPSATLAVVGPAAATPRMILSLRRTDAALATACDDEGAAYLSPLRQRWLPLLTLSRYMDATAHPNNEGHARLARRLAVALESLADERRDPAGDPAG